MAIYIGDNQLVKRYVGTQEVQRTYIGSQLVWELDSGPSWPGATATIPAQTPPSGGGVFTGSAITIPETFTGQARLRIEIKWANRASRQLYRIRLNENGSAATGWESAPDGSGAYTQTLEIGYGSNPYPNPLALTPGSVYEVECWPSATNAANRAINQSAFTIESV